MILLARYLDGLVSMPTSDCSSQFLTTPLSMILIPTLQYFVSNSFSNTIPLYSSDSWAEAVTWYKRAVDCAMVGVGSSCSHPDEGFDAEGRYDAAEDLLPVYRILARMAELYCVGGSGLKQDYLMAGMCYIL